MNPLTRLKQTILPLLVAIVLACFGLLPQVQAVSPAPDGCYPNFTTAEGCDALNLLTDRRWKYRTWLAFALRG